MTEGDQVEKEEMGIQWECIHQMERMRTMTRGPRKKNTIQPTDKPIEDAISS